jgi:hypothetical protein
MRPFERSSAATRAEAEHNHGYENEWEEAHKSEDDQECERAARRREKNECAQDEKDRREEEGTGPEDGRETGYCPQDVGAENLRAQDHQEGGTETRRAQGAGPQACGGGEAYGSCCT